jgi:F5/8 type C domain
MRYPITRNFHIRTGRCCFVLMLSALSAAFGAGEPHEPANLAINKPACSSSIENDEHNAAQANDNNSDTCWRADDEPEGGPEWWQVDLQKTANLSGCQIIWPYDGINYRCKVEGSADKKTWVLLSDQTKTAARNQIRNIKFTSAKGIRYVKVTITGFDDGCWASLSEVKIFGSTEPLETGSQPSWTRK